MNKRLFLLIGLICLFLLAACANNSESVQTSSEDKEEKAKQQEKEVPEYPEAATDVGGMLNEGPGDLLSEFDETKDNPSIDFEKLTKDIPSSVTTDEAYNGIVSMFAADYSEVVDAFDTYSSDFESLSDSEEEVEEENVAILLDSSGSMAGQVSGGIKMDLAKEALKRFSSGLPEDANVLLRVYGHKGSNDDGDKELSCSSNDVFYELHPYEEALFNKALGQFEPTGWTPLGAAIQSIESDFTGMTGDDVRNTVYIVSDGVETCGGNPVEEAKKLNNSDLNVTVNIIGFNVDTEGRKQLEDTAEAGGGVYETVNSKVELNDTLAELLKDAHEGIKANSTAALEGVDVNKALLEKKKTLDKIQSEFNDVIQLEEDRLLAATDELEFSEKLTADQADELEDKINQRSEKLHEYSDTRHKELYEETEKKKDEMFEKIEEKRAS